MSGAGQTAAIDRFSLAGRVALITGSGGGIGRELARAMGEAGARVVLHDIDEAHLEPGQALLAEGGVEHAAFTADLADVTACRTLIRNAHDAYGRLDVLVNCAAANKREPVLEVQPETFDWLVAVNVRAPFFLSAAAVPYMRSQGGGAIVNVSSLNAFYALDTVAVYGLTKAAIRQMTAEMAVEFAPDHIRVNALVPGFVITPMNERSLWGVPRKRAWILDRVPAARPGVPEDMVGTVLFLASDASAFVTGQCIVVDGGFLAGGSWAYQGSAEPDYAEPDYTGTLKS